ncbi:MAG: hypothetical protein ACE14M_04725 [Terriglobales bacterium]
MNMLSRAAQIPPSASGVQVSVLFSHPGYNYAPSIIANGNLRDVWWCGLGSTPGRLMTDVIYHSALNIITGTWSPIQQVLWPSPSGWDSRYTCDPSVIKGSFQNPDNGQTYSFALYYTATDAASGVNNRIGVAFSNDGINWTKYSGNPVIHPQVEPTVTYGAGQASTYSQDAGSSLILFHTDDSTNVGARVWVHTTSDGIHFVPPTLLSNQGATLYANNDFAFDPASQQFYAAIELPVTPPNRETSGFALCRMPASSLLSGSGTWEQLAVVSTSNTGQALNHSPGLVRDGYGNVVGLPVLETYFASGTNDPSTWTLYSARWSGE